MNQRHSYNTRLASKSSYSLPKVRTNYGKFNIKYCGAITWNNITEPIKKLSKTKFKERLITDMQESYSN